MLSLFFCSTGCLWWILLDQQYRQFLEWAVDAFLNLLVQEYPLLLLQWIGVLEIIAAPPSLFCLVLVKPLSSVFFSSLQVTLILLRCLLLESLAQIATFDLTDFLSLFFFHSVVVGRFAHPSCLSVPPQDKWPSPEGESLLLLHAFSHHWGPAYCSLESSNWSFFLECLGFSLSHLFIMLWMILFALDPGLYGFYEDLWSV